MEDSRHIDANELPLPLIRAENGVEDLAPEVNYSAASPEKWTPVIKELIKHGDEAKQDSNEKSRPGEVLEKVVHAAEKGQAIEKKFERRHEIKDQSSSAHQRSSSDMAPIGSLLAARHQQPPVAQPSKPADRSPTWYMQVLHNNDAYAVAIKYGFLTALFILIVVFMLTTILT